MAAILCDICEGDEVIMPSYTFVSTANAFVLRGGVPVFVDIRKDTLNIDESKIEAAITDRTRAIVPVHYAGVPCEMDKINEIARKYGLYVIEDAAQALLSKYKGEYLGAIGDFGTVSFHETKNIISGEGGALLINDERFIERAEIIWEKGTNRKKFFKGEIDKYTWVDIGSSYLPSELVAAFLMSQLEQAEQIIAARRRLFNTYYSSLEQLQSEGKILLPKVDRVHGYNGHIFYVITKSIQERTALLEYLRSQNITSVFHYIPLHSSPAGQKYCRQSDNLSVTDMMSERVLRLPLYYEMTDSEITYVIDHVKAFYNKDSINCD
jgi:dTDP-4-amino-4,6-dideoxygalactose transaminase